MRKGQLNGNGYRALMNISECTIMNRLIHWHKMMKGCAKN
jgi:hypothetical protein